MNDQLLQTILQTLKNIETHVERLHSIENLLENVRGDIQRTAHSNTKIESMTNRAWQAYDDINNKTNKRQ